MKVGVTGARGFVGRTATEVLAKAGVEVLRLGRGERENPVEPSTLLMPWRPEDFAGMDCVVHLAAITDPLASSETMNAVNSELAQSTARAAAAVGVRRFVFMSSISVHGRASGRAIGPDAPFNPVNDYGRSKANAEVALATLCPSIGLELVVLRPPMIYGAGGSGSFDALSRLVVKGFPLPLGAATARRSFCSIHNVASATAMAVATQKTGVFIPADPEDVSPKSLVESIAAALGRRRPVLLPIPSAAMRVALGCVGKRELASSLFDPLMVDRGHWSEWNWCPVQSSGEGVSEAVRGSDYGGPQLRSPAGRQACPSGPVTILK